MVMDAGTPEAREVRRLRRALVESETRLKPFRKRRRDFLARYVGSQYGASSVVGKRPLNQIHGLISTLIPALVSANPKVWLKPKTPKKEMAANLLGQRLDRWAEEIRLVDRLQALVLEGLVGPGIMWTGLAAGREEEFGDYWLDVGQVATRVVSLEDYCCDPHARHRAEMVFEGHAYDVPVEYVREKADDGFFQNADLLIEGGQTEGSEREAGDLSGRTRRVGGDWELVPTVQLVDLWMPRERQVWTLAPEGRGDLPLRVVDYDGPEGGPYDMLSFYDVPDNPFPLSPVAVIYDLDDAVNVMGRKMVRQVERQKRFGVASNVDAGDAEVCRTVDDGGMVTLGNPEAVKEVQLGGAPGETFNILGWMIQQTSQLGGNTNLRGGRQAQEPTLGQTEILSEQLGMSLGYMRDRLRGCVAKIYEKAMWHLVRHELGGVPVTVAVPGLAKPVPIVMEPEDWEELDAADMGVDVEPYSMAPQSPQQMVRKTVEFLGVMAPFIPLLEAQGKALDAETIMRKLGRLYGIQEIDAFLAGTASAPVGPVPQLGGAEGARRTSVPHMATPQVGPGSNPGGA